MEWKGSGGNVGNILTNKHKYGIIMIEQIKYYKKTKGKTKNE